MSPVEANPLATVASGLLLGWSVAWPPGPINAEMIRRALARGFWPAYSVGLGACSGDFLWALGVALGAGALADVPGVRPALAAISLTLLLYLAWSFLSGAVRSWRRLRSGHPPEESGGRLETSRGGYLLGLSMALSSPWNIAFWLAVIGRQAGATLAFGNSLLLAGAVVTAAAAWGLILCSAVRAGARFATPAWEIGTRAATGLLMLFFAVQLTLRLAAA
jgi:threonine/homoserine/homoserine lactone efflux protein